MAIISFKSVGQKQQKAVDSKLTKSMMPIGIKTPLRINVNSGLLDMHFSLEQQLSDNLKNLLLTNWGERVGQYFFGANLLPLTSEFVAQDGFDNEAIIRIKDAAEKWMPYIDLVDFSSETDRVENRNIGIIKITISYNILALQVSNKKLQIVLYVM